MSGTGAAARPARKPVPKPRAAKHSFLDELQYGNALLFYRSARTTLILAHLGVLAGLICVGVYNIAISKDVGCDDIIYDKLHRRTIFDTCAALAARNDTQLGVVKMFDGTEWVAEWNEYEHETHFGMSSHTKTLRSIMLVTLPLVLVFSLQFVFRYVVTTHSLYGFNRRIGQGNAGWPELRAIVVGQLARRKGAIRKGSFLTYLVIGVVCLGGEAGIVVAAYVVMTSDYHTVDDCTCVDNVALEGLAGVMSFLFAALYFFTVIVNMCRKTAKVDNRYGTMSIAELSATHYARLEEA